MKRSVFIFLLSVLSLLPAGCGLQPGTEMMLNRQGAELVEAAAQMRSFGSESESGRFDYRTSEGTKVRVISDDRGWLDPSGGIKVYILEGNLRNQTYTVDRDWLLSMTSTR